MKRNRNDVQTDETMSDEDNEISFGVGGRVFIGLLLGFLLLGGAGGWAATAQLTGAVIAHGAVKVDQNLKAVQHRDGGTIKEIAVREGDFVTKGQVIVALDDVQVRAELAIIRSQLAEAEVKKARLIAERDSLEQLQMPLVLVAATNHIESLMLGETRLLEGNLRNRASQKSQLEYSVDQFGQEIEGLEAQKRSKDSEIALADIENAKLKGLADKRLIEGSRLYTGKRDMARMIGERGEIEAQIARAKSRISEIKLQILAVDETARTEAQRELSVLDPRISELNERRVAIEDRLLRTDIRAPISGTINELSVHTLGGVVTPAETLVTIVPEDAILKVEVRLSPTDIDQIHLGQATRLRFSTFNQRTTPELKGEVSYISAATTVDKSTNQPVYLADITVGPDELAKLGGNALLPGMPVEAFMSTAPRTAMNYLSKPFMDQFSRAFKEE